MPSREAIAKRYLDAMLMRLWWVQNDPEAPEKDRKQFANYGLAADEFPDNDHVPYEIYVREARRMVGHFVMTENELTKKKPTPDSVGMGSYTIDSHNVQRYITPEGYVQNEGDIGVGISPYAIAYGALVPRRGQADNLLVSICVSSSHIAFGSIRRTRAGRPSSLLCRTTIRLRVPGSVVTKTGLGIATPGR